MLLCIVCPSVLSICVSARLSLASVVRLQIRHFQRIGHLSHVMGMWLKRLIAPKVESLVVSIEIAVCSSQGEVHYSCYFNCRGKGEGSGAATLPANRESLPSPASSRPSEPLPRTTSHSRRNQPTRALRIEGFVRPFTEPAAQAMLSETGDILSMWMPKIKTHAFVIYATLGQAEATLKATQNLNWPEAVPASK